MKSDITIARKDSKHWQLFLATGVFFLMMGVYVLFYPFEKAVGSDNIFGTLGLTTGLAKIIFAVRCKHRLSAKKWRIAIGISEILAGIFLLSYNAFAMVILPFLLSFWILAGAVTLIEELTGLQNFHASQAEWMIAAITVTLVSTCIVAFLPFLGIVTTIFWTATCLFILGIFYVHLSLRLKSLKKHFFKQ